MSKRFLILGIIFVILGLIIMFEPYYTYANQINHPCRIGINPDDTLFELENLNPGDQITKELIITKIGEDTATLYLFTDYIDIYGSLSEQLVIIIKIDDITLYNGKLHELPQTINIIPDIKYEDEIAINITIKLPPNTTNIYQGNISELNLVFFTRCNRQEGIEVDPEEPLVTPPDTPLTEPLPRTDGHVVSILLIGMVLIGAGTKLYK